MALKCFVKVGNVTNLSDARYCAGMGVDLLGFPVDAAQPGPVAPHVSYFLLESEAGTLGEAARAAVAEIAKQYPVLLGFGLEPATVEAVLAQTAARGIALKGSQEIRPGYKDFGALADLLEALED
jgi:phosphoribosylanthranilate isomerase